MELSKFILIFLSFCFSFNILCEEKKYEMLDQIIAIVEKSVITNIEFEKELKKNIRKLNDQNIYTYDKKKLDEDTLNYLIEKKLLTQYAENLNINISQQELDLTIESIIKNNQITMEELKAEFMENSLEFKDFQDDISYNLTLRKIKEREIAPNIKVSDHEIDIELAENVKNNSTKYKLSHILVKKDNKEKLNIIKDALLTDEFFKVAQKYSDGPYSENGGDLGWMNLSEIPDSFLEEIKKLQKGDATNFFESSNGYHMLKIEDINDNKEKIYLEEFNIQQIFIKNNAIQNDEEILQKLNNIKNLIINGLDFDEAIKKYSNEFIDSENPSKWLKKEQIPIELKNLIDEKYPNEKLLGPIKTEFGWHIVEILDYRERDITQESKRDIVRFELMQKKIEMRFKDWLKALKVQSNIKILNE
jgi:peptidyl-prolyl cis-trans isomerase SurA